MTENRQQARLILASSSPYRRQLLAKLQIPFTCIAPALDETQQAGESAEQLVQRLSSEKAAAVAGQLAEDDNCIIIGSDQLAVLDGQILGKPLTDENARLQLAACSGKTVHFLTGLCLHLHPSGKRHSLLEPFAVTFRTLSTAQIERYLQAEKPLDCAGSFKAEGLGIALFEKMHGDDPNSLIGLPLIRLITLLNQTGLAIP